MASSSGKDKRAARANKPILRLTSDINDNDDDSAPRGRSRSPIDSRENRATSHPKGLLEGDNQTHGHDQEDGTGEIMPETGEVFRPKSPSIVSDMDSDDFLGFAPVFDRKGKSKGSKATATKTSSSVFSP